MNTVTNFWRNHVVGTTVALSAATTTVKVGPFRFGGVTTKYPRESVWILSIWQGRVIVIAEDGVTVTMASIQCIDNQIVRIDAI